MTVNDANLISILQHSLFILTDLGYIADGTESTEFKKGELLFAYRDDQDRFQSVRIYYTLDMATGEVTFTPQ